MKYSFLLFVLLAMVLVIAACLANNTYVTPKPGVYNSAASQKIRANNAMQQAQQQEGDADAAAVYETAQAQDAANFPATESALFAQQTGQALDAKATDDARVILLAQQQAQTTASAQAMSTQQAAEAVEAKATIDARAMLLAQQQGKATATAEAMQREGVTAGQVARLAQQQREFISWFIPISVTMAFGLVLYVGAKFISGMIDAANERRRWENKRLALPGMFIDVPTEKIVLASVPQTGFIPLQPFNTPDHSNKDDGVINSHEPIINDEVQPVIVDPFSGDKMVTNRAEANEEVAHYKLAMRLLRDAINHLGAQSNRIPPAAQLGWPAEAWTIAMAILRPFGVEILQGTEGGTYLVGQYPTLLGLYTAIGEKRLTVYPSSAESTTKGWNRLSSDPTIGMLHQRKYVEAL